MTDTPSPTEPQHPSGTTRDERTMALFAHALTFFEGGILGPLVLYLWKKDESEFIAFHALQSMIFGVIAAVVIIIASIITCGFGAILVVPYLALEAVACFRAYEGEWYQLPIAGPMALKNHHP